MAVSVVMDVHNWLDVWIRFGKKHGKMNGFSLFYYRTNELRQPIHLPRYSYARLNSQGGCMVEKAQRTEQFITKRTGRRTQDKPITDKWTQSKTILTVLPFHAEITSDSLRFSNNVTPHFTNGAFVIIDYCFADGGNFLLSRQRLFKWIYRYILS